MEHRTDVGEHARPLVGGDARRGGARGIGQIEACGGGHIPTRHYDPVELAGDGEALAPLPRHARASAGCGSCSFSCHGNPCIPTRRGPPRTTPTSWPPAGSRPSSGVTHVSLLAGLPAGAPGDTHAELDHQLVVSRPRRRLSLAVGGARAAVLARGGARSRTTTASCCASSRTRRTWSTTRRPSGACATRSARDRHELRPLAPLVAGNRPDRRGRGGRRRDDPTAT